MRKFYCMGSVCVFSHPTQVYLYSRTLHRHIYMYILAPSKCMFVCSHPIRAYLHLYFRTLHMHTCICMLSHPPHAYSPRLHICLPQLEILKRICVFSHPTHAYVYLYSRTAHMCFLTTYTPARHNSKFSKGSLYSCTLYMYICILSP